MPSLCLYFQVHQPYRLYPYHYFDIEAKENYFDDEKNRKILNKVSDKCYLPSNEIFLELIHKYEGKFRLSLSLSGLVLEQFEKYRPDVLHSFQRLSATNCVEFLSETFAHSLSSVYSEQEFIRQIEKHKEIIYKYFGKKTEVFRNTELIYHNKIAQIIEKLGYKAMLSEGSERFLQDRSPNHIYRAKETKNLKLLLKNYKLSDDIAFRFSDKQSGFYPLDSTKFSRWIHQLNGNAEVINLFMDFETFGEHQWKESGIFDFLKNLPGAILKNKEFDFRTPNECIETYPERGVYDVPEYLSWADTERDLSAWISNDLQKESIKKLYQLEEKVMITGNQQILQKFEYFQASDHFYYMCTKFWNDGDVHKYFSPYDSPYEAYIYFMNAISDFEMRLDRYYQEGGYSDKSVQKENSNPQASIITLSN